MQVVAVKFKDRALHWAAVVSPDGKISDGEIRLMTLKNDSVTDQQRSAEITFAYSVSLATMFSIGNSSPYSTSVILSRVSAFH